MIKNLTKIDWNKIEQSNALILKENEPLRVKFLDNGDVDDYELIDKETNEKKIVDKYSFDVINLANNEKKILSTLALTLMLRLKEYQPLKDKSLTINKFKTGFSNFDVDFKVSLIE